MKTYKVLVEDSRGIRAVHYVDAVFPSDAKEREESLGYTVLSVDAVGD